MAMERHGASASADQEEDRHHPSSRINILGVLLISVAIGLALLGVMIFFGFSLFKSVLAAWIASLCLTVLLPVFILVVRGQAVVGGARR